MKDAVKEWKHGMTMEVYVERIENLVTVCDKSLNVGGDYIGKTKGL